jgi:phosphoribosylformimino-5-aminoimidazole carboxamide ribotide isomerase
VYTKGWITKTRVRAIDLAKKIEKLGFRRINYTDISRDGMLEGPNIDSLKELISATSLDVVASGGISNIDDIKRLQALKETHLVGVIIGKALYENKIDLGEAIKICSQKE